MQHGAEALRRTYREQGFVLVPGLLSGETLNEIASDIAGVFVRRADALGLNVPRGSGRSDITRQLVALYDADPSNYTASAKLTQHLVGVHRLGVGPEIVSTVRALGLDVPSISTRPVIHYMADRLRIAGGYHKTPVHQDWRSVQGSVDGMTIWLPLFDVGEDDYPLEIVPGSHRHGLLPSEEHAFGHCVTDSAIGDATFVSVPIRRGDVLFFSGFLMHRTGERGGALVRIALSYRFNNAADPSFALRNYPDRYVYKAQMELLDSAFPPQEQVDRIFAEKSR